MMRIRTVVVSAISLFATTFMFQDRCVAQTISPPVTQSEQETDERGTVKSVEFVNSRRNARNPNTKSHFYRRRTNTGKSPNAKSSPPANGKIYVSIGITIGRGRPATEAEIKQDSTAKVQGSCLERRGVECLRRQQMVVERISDSTPITHGTPVQMMIEYLATRDEAGKIQESGRLGYLYVINRVEFKHKSAGISKPKLIFPTESTFGGDNRVLPGKIVMLPEPDRLWQITRNKIAAQEFETYIIIISPEPLKNLNGEEIQPGKAALELSDELVNGWIEQWGEVEMQLDLEHGVGQLITKREQVAGGKPTDVKRDTEEMDTDLKLDDPPPQMGFSKAIVPGGTMLVTIKLPFTDSTAIAVPKP